MYAQQKWVLAAGARICLRRTSRKKANHALDLPFNSQIKERASRGDRWQLLMILPTPLSFVHPPLCCQRIFNQLLGPEEKVDLSPG